MNFFRNAVQKLENGLDWAQEKVESTGRFVENLRNYEFPQGYRTGGAIIGALTPLALWSGMMTPMTEPWYIGAIAGIITYPFLGPVALGASSVGAYIGHDLGSAIDKKFGDERARPLIFDRRFHQACERVKKPKKAGKVRTA